MRYLTPLIERDLNKKMVFLGGPRQCGKTTLAQALLKHRPGVYLNWDNPRQKKQILAQAWSDEERLVVLDELHKFGKWKNWIKGAFDTQKERHQYLLTGSARLDVYRRGGDSLFGRKRNRSYAVARRARKACVQRRHQKPRKHPRSLDHGTLH